MKPRISILERALTRNRCNLWMSGGSSFTKRNGAASGTALQDFNPEDIGLAFQNGWTQTPPSQWPQLLDYPEYNVPNPVGAMNSFKIFQSGLPMIMAPTTTPSTAGAFTRQRQHQPRKE